MGMVWDLPIDRDKKFVLLAYSDHADHDGKNIYPAIMTLCKKTGYSERSVQVITRKLEADRLLIADGFGNHGTKRWRIPVVGDRIDYPYTGAVSAPVQILRGAENDIEGCRKQQGGVQKTAERGAVATAPESSLTIIKPSIKDKKINSSILLKKNKRSIPEGLPEPSGDIMGDWLKMGEAQQIKNAPLVAIIETLASGFSYNFPQYGESQSLDRVIKKILADGRDVNKFINWAKANKRDPHWYHLKPDTLWGDWPQAFSSNSLSVYDVLSKQLEEEGHGRSV
jgi:hypothetical protein